MMSMTSQDSVVQIRLLNIFLLIAAIQFILLVCIIVPMFYIKLDVSWSILNDFGMKTLVKPLEFFLSNFSLRIGIFLFCSVLLIALQFCLKNKLCVGFVSVIAIQPFNCILAILALPHIG